VCSVDCGIVLVGGVFVGIVGVLTGNIPYLNFGRDIGRCDGDGFRDKIWIVARLLNNRRR